MRTTVVIDGDIAGHRAATAVKYEHRTSALGLKVDVTNIGDVLDLLDDEPRR